MSSPQQAATHAPEASALNAEAASFIPDDSPCQLENFDFSCHNGDFLKELLEDDLTKMERLERYGPVKKKFAFRADNPC